MASRHRSRLALAAATLLLAVTAATAASDRRPPSRLDGRIRHLEGGAISVLPLEPEGLDASDELRSRWEQFQARNGGGWTVYLDERTAQPTLVAGRGIPWSPDEPGGDRSLEDLDERARRFFAESVPLLGARSDLLELDEAASLRLRDGHWQLVYRQRVDGVRVENARFDLHVVRGRLVMLGATHWGRPTASGIPTLDAEQSRDLLDGYLGDDAAGLTPVGPPELTLIAVDADPLEGEARAWSGARGEGLKHVLVWRFRFDQADAAARWVGEVDAHDGSIRAFYEATEYVAVRGGVFPVGNDGDCASGGCEVAGFPMPYADYQEAGQSEQFADSFGNLMCGVPDATIETSLSGPYVHIADTCGAVAEPGTCTDGLDMGLKFGQNCDVAPGASAGNTAAARTAYYHVNRVAEIARFYDPENTWLESPLTINVNIGSSCNANWDGTAINMYGAGGNCNNTGENPDILVHEWGHGYDHNDGGGMDNPGEAYADIVAILTTRDSCMGRGAYNDGSTCTGYGDTCLTCTGFRDFDWAARQSNTPATPTNFATTLCPVDTSGFAGPCRREAHCESYVSSEAIFDLATRDLPAAGMDQDSAWQLVERLWFVTRLGSGGDAYSCLPPLSNSCGVTSWYQRMRVADDDDGDLANGTPHAAAIFAAFERHDIACGTAGDATNQSNSSCPALTAPVVTRSVTPAGVELSWSPVAGGAEYRVYRGELGCDRQQVPIASLAGGQTTYLDNSMDSDLLRYYRVEAFGANAACSSPVSACVGAPPGSRLQAVSHRVVDDGDGVPEPGETLRLPVTLLNTGVDAAVSPAATLTLVGPADVRILDPNATWSSIASNTTAESDAPHFELVVLEQASCGATLTLDLNGAAANSTPFTAQIRIPMGTTQRDYTETVIEPIPSLTPEPVEVYFDVPDDKTIAELDLTIDIFHQDPTQLIVELRSPQGTTVRLHDRGAGSGHGIETRFDLDTAPDGPGSMADFNGESTLGLWTLSVEDVDPTGVTTEGYIRPRTLHVAVEGAYDCDPQTCDDPTPGTAPDLRVDTAANGPQIDLVLSWSPVPAAAGYHVLQSVDPAFGSAVQLIANTTTETDLTLPDGVQTTPALSFFQVRGVNSCNQEGP